MPCHASPNRAARRSAASEPPPTRIGTRAVGVGAKTPGAPAPVVPVAWSRSSSASVEARVLGVLDEPFRRAGVVGGILGREDEADAGHAGTRCSTMSIAARHGAGASTPTT
jgi:hypothetical protein